MRATRSSRRVTRWEGSAEGADGFTDRVELGAGQGGQKLIEELHSSPSSAFHDSAPLRRRPHQGGPSVAGVISPLGEPRSVEAGDDLGHRRTRDLLGGC